MSATVSSSPGDTKDTFKMEQIQNPDEHVYEKITENRVNDDTYVKLKRERKNDSDHSERNKLNTRKLIIVILCSVVICIVVSVVLITAVAYAVFKGSVTDGGWTDWEDWGACSVTCGSGFTTRIRTCSNPRPSIMGRYCDGTSLHVQSCNNTSCSVKDGGWTGWEDWGACSVTCGTGFTTRIRTCSNPRPSIMGRYCDGTSVQVQTCNSASCSVTDGGWTNWGNWGVCSVTCGVGLITRLRTCSNPQPSLTGRYCDGTSEQTKICNDMPCSGDSVGFSVHQPYGNSGGNPLTFHTAFYNNNDVFNMTSGEFVCQKEGLYLFISTLLRTNDTISSLSCKFYKNDDMSIAYGSHASSNNASDNPSGTSSIVSFKARRSGLSGVMLWHALYG